MRSTSEPSSGNSSNTRNPGNPGNPGNRVSRPSNPAPGKSEEFHALHGRPLPPEFTMQVRRETQEWAAASRAVNRRTQLKAVRQLAHRFLVGEFTPEQVRTRLEQHAKFVLDPATVQTEFFARIAYLRGLWIKPRDRYAIKLAVMLRLAQPGSLDLGAGLKQIRQKYGDEAVNHAIGEELVQRTTCNRPLRMASYSTQREGAIEDIATLTRLLNTQPPNLPS